MTTHHVVVGSVHGHKIMKSLTAGNFAGVRTIQAVVILFQAMRCHHVCVGSGPELIIVKSQTFGKIAGVRTTIPSHICSPSTVFLHTYDATSAG
jgi:hypothetical protein